MFIFLDGGNFANANKANKTTNECAKKEYKERKKNKIKQKSLSFCFFFFVVKIWLCGHAPKRNIEIRASKQKELYANEMKWFLW